MSVNNSVVKDIELRRDVGLFERREGKERRGRERETVLPLRYSNMRYNFPSV